MNEKEYTVEEVKDRMKLPHPLLVVGDIVLFLLPANLESETEPPYVISNESTTEYAAYDVEEAVDVFNKLIRGIPESTGE